MEFERRIDLSKKSLKLTHRLDKKREITNVGSSEKMDSYVMNKIEDYALDVLH